MWTTYLWTYLAKKNAGRNNFFTVCNVTDASKEKVLVRKSSICTGNTVELGSFGTSAEDCEWNILAQDSTDAVNNHTADCDGSNAKPAGGTSNIDDTGAVVTSSDGTETSEVIATSSMDAGAVVTSSDGTETSEVMASSSTGIESNAFDLSSGSVSLAAWLVPLILLVVFLGIGAVFLWKWRHRHGLGYKSDNLNDDADVEGMMEFDRYPDPSNGIGETNGVEINEQPYKNLVGSDTNDGGI